LLLAADSLNYPEDESAFFCLLFWKTAVKSPIRFEISI
jgi:hypothetical protein